MDGMSLHCNVPEKPAIGLKHEIAEVLQGVGRIDFWFLLLGFAII